ncbi:hypothetical protein FKM82_012059 [Ascaphus truei]
MTDVVEVDDAVFDIVSRSLEPPKKKKKAGNNFNNDSIAMEAKKIQMMENMFGGPPDANMEFLKCLWLFLHNLYPAKNMRLRQ